MTLLVMVSIASFRSPSVQREVDFVKYAPIRTKIDDNASYGLGCGYLGNKNKPIGDITVGDTHVFSTFRPKLGVMTEHICWPISW